MSTKTPSLQSITVGHHESETLSAKLIRKSPRRKPKSNVTLPSYSNVAALFVKNWITMKRNILLLLFVFFLPGIVLLINSLTIGLSPRNLPLALVNLEDNCTDQSYTRRCEANMLGCYFKKSLNDSETVNLIHYPSISTAERDVRAAVVRGLVVVPPHFSVSYLKRILGVNSWRWSEFTYFYSVEDEDVATNETINIALDASDPQLVLFIKKAITDAVDNMVANITELCEDELGDEGIDLSMVSVGSPLLGDEDSDYREFITPGMICVAIFFLAMALTSESFITERSQGLLERSWITGVLPVEIITSYIMSQFLVMVMQATITYITVFAVFKIPCRGPIGWCIVLTLLQGKL